MTTPAWASPELRAPLLSGQAGCDVAADLTHLCSQVSQSYVKVKLDDDGERDALRAEITLRDGTPSTTYDVWVNPAKSVTNAVICAEPDPNSAPNPVGEVEDHPHPKGSPITTDSRGRAKLRLLVDSTDSAFSVCVVPRVGAPSPARGAGK